MWLGSVDMGQSDREGIERIVYTAKCPLYINRRLYSGERCHKVGSERWLIGSARRPNLLNSLIPLSKATLKTPHL